MKTCKKCSRSEPTISFSSLAPNYCIDCHSEEHRKATAILDSYNEIKKKNDETSLEKTIEYAEKLKEYHFEGILDLIGGVKDLDQIISICKKQLREREREQIRRKIKRLEKKTNRTPQEEAELENLRKKLKELEKNNQEENPFNYLPWIIGGSVLVIGIIISVLLFRKSKKRCYY